MNFPEFKHEEAELQILDFWKKEKVLEKLRKKNSKGPSFYFLEGPPYTSGNIHLGHAWNMALKDMVLRYKRMRGFNVWDRMGYDMHGLPTEQKAMARLNLKNKQDIEQFGVKQFVQECEKFCLEMMHKMNEDFQRLGSTLDFSDPYQPITTEFMEAEWWLIKQAHEKGRLYQGLRTMHWDPATQTAVAKHELEYQQTRDTAIYLKFRLHNHPQKYFIVWTTTPWTVPLNLAIMVHPDLDYVEVQAGPEIWIVGKHLAEKVMARAGFEQCTILKEFKGKTLAGEKYIHPLTVGKLLPTDLQKNKSLFTVLLTTEYVDDTSGTGLVHCSPGCGPEDYEVGHLYHLPPFNCVNEEGYFENFGPFSSWKAKTDDKKFIHALEQAGALVAKEQYVHDYPYGERSHEPVIFRTTKQWFFKVEDLKKQMLAANADIYWNPESGRNAFNSWLDNLRDNSITKQRYWGTPVPIWQAEDGDYIVVGSIAELERLSLQKMKGMHIPNIDQITIKKDGKVYKRIPDVLDVWIDAGTVSWNCLHYPQQKKIFNKLFPADFILEGKDQIRGWYNLLMVASFLALEKPSFKNVYMHGFVTDVLGVKMSKSLGNIISPYEVITKHGADVLRYYTSQTNAGQDINFSWEECAAKQRSLMILWNVHKLLINLSKEHGINPTKLKKAAMEKVMALEEHYMFSKLNSTIKQVTELMEQYRLDETIGPLEELYLELSRTYIQMVREKSAVGDDEEKEICVYTIYAVLLEFLKMFSIIAPFISEAIYQNLREEFQPKEISITHCTWPSVEKKKINLELEQAVAVLQGVTQAVLSAREKVKLNLRWPVKEIFLVNQNIEVSSALELLQDVLRKQTNTKSFKIIDAMPRVKIIIKPDYKKIGPKYGELSPQIIARLSIDSAETILRHVERDGSYNFAVNGTTVSITREMLVIQQEAPAGFVAADSKYGSVYVNLERTEELEAEGYAREMMRNIQQARKNAGLTKIDEIVLFVKVNPQMKKMADTYKKDVMQKVGALKMEISLIDPQRRLARSEEFMIKKEKFAIWFEKVK